MSYLKYLGDAAFSAYRFFYTRKERVNVPTYLKLTAFASKQPNPDTVYPSIASSNGMDGPKNDAKRMKLLNYPLKNLRKDMAFVLGSFKTSNQLEPDYSSYSVNYLEYMDKLFNAGIPLIKLILAYKQSKDGISENEKRVIHLSELEQMLIDLANKPLNYGEKQCVKMIVQNVTHFHYLEIELTGNEAGNKMSIASLDSVDNGESKAKLMRLKEKHPFIEHVFCTSENLQHDTVTCFIFALKLFFAASKEQNLHQFLSNIASPSGEVKWSDFPPSFLKLCQSKSLYNKILLRAYYQQYSYAFLNSLDLNTVIRKFQNYGLSQDNIESASSLTSNSINQYASEKPIALDFFDRQLNRKGQTILSYFAAHSASTPSFVDPNNLAALHTLEHYGVVIRGVLDQISDDELISILVGNQPFPIDKVPNAQVKEAGVIISPKS